MTGTPYTGAPVKTAAVKKSGDIRLTGGVKQEPKRVKKARENALKGSEPR